MLHLESLIPLLLLVPVAFGASLLTFYSGFGLGTLLLPAFLFFFPPEQAVVLTAVIHFLNNLAKTGLLLREANLKLLFLFGLPSAAGAWFGARFLLYTAAAPVSFSLPLIEHMHIVAEPLPLCIGLVLIAFAFAETALKPLEHPNKIQLTAGGFLSGFFGGFSGHQGALRSLFLSRATAEKAVFIATGSAIALAVDAIRISSYAAEGLLVKALEQPVLLVGALLAALAGALTGNHFLEKVTLRGVHQFVKWGLIGTGIFTILTSITPYS